MTALWSELGRLGWYKVGLEQDDPFGTPGLCLLAAECGRRVAPQLLVDTAVAARIVASGSDEPRARCCPVATGEVPVALCVVEPEVDWSLAGLAEAVPVPGGIWLDATKLLSMSTTRVMQRGWRWSRGWPGRLGWRSSRPTLLA